MKTVLKDFITKPLFDASAEMLEHLHIQFSSQSKTPIDFGNFYVQATSQKMPKQLSEVVEKVKETYFIGAIDEETLEGHQTTYDLDAPIDGKYQTMMVFAVDIKQGETMTRNELAILTRGFNRLASSLPVILFVKNGNKLSLATCERSEYNQNWRNGEKIGKVSILRDINLEYPHRGHLDILESLGDKVYPTFDALYEHWLEVFSTELLTYKFYTELSEWYAWVIESGKVKFPNNINTTEDDTKYNHEAVIRLITRLIFVWFLKQKKLIPEEFFDETAIQKNFIENFDPHSTNTLFYNPEESKYYRLILQNLFFAMLNKPIKDEETGNEENRRFVTDKRYKGISADFNINNLLRYKSEFKEGGADKLLEVANSQVPFLNGGLFECLDHKDKEDPEYGMYYDGFTENPVARKQLSFPDYFFFGEEVGKNIDLSKWFGFEKKTNVRGLINILKRYNFTVEENTPLDQEISLDPELLGKAFENLLASYNPETKTTARKQTGSFYTPRPIVQYMVDETLFEYLKRTCKDINESKIRNLLDYSNESFDLANDERKALMSALYSCKVLDPACGSGAFPMGILQQMVHALRKLDPTNEMWKEFILEIALGKDREAYKIENEEERTVRRRDIEEAFNQHVNDPDYARKLYLIENCIYGVDIQPIAAQISKLRFFISLIAEQKPTLDASCNFGIRPLPNLEAKIVAANSLVSIGEDNLFTDTIEIQEIKKELSDVNHKLFIAKKNTEKRKLKELIRNIRKKYSKELISNGSISEDSALKLANWDMFNQNTSSSFFDVEWMFGLKKGFDIIIGNPPYIRRTNIPSQDKKIYEKKYFSAKGQYDIYLLFIELGIKLLKKNGILCFINPLRFFNADYGVGARTYISQNTSIKQIIDVSQLKVFQSAMTYPCILLLEKNINLDKILFVRPSTIDEISALPIEKKIYFDHNNIRKDKTKRFLIGNDKLFALIKRIEDKSLPFAAYYTVARGLANNLVNFNSSKYLALKSKQVKKYHIEGNGLGIDTASPEVFSSKMIIMPRTVAYLQATIKPENIICLDRIYYLIKGNRVDDDLPFIGVFNSKLINFWFEFNYWSTKVSGNYFDLNGTQILSVPFPTDLLANKEFNNMVLKALNGNELAEKEIDDFLFDYFSVSLEEMELMKEFMEFNGHTL